MSISNQQESDIMFEYLNGMQPKRGKASYRSRNPLIRMPIAPRLVLGFLLPALIAALVAGIIGAQSAQLLNQESAFYQNLFQSYANLTTGNDFLQLMDFKTHATITDALAPNTARDQLTGDQQAVQGLVNRYDLLLKAYVQKDLLAQHPDQAALFEQAGHPGQASQQSILASSALRTWNVYRDAQNAVLQEIQQGHVQAAQTLERTQGEPTYFDALSALRQLIQFDGRLTSFVQDATALQERTQLITTLAAVLLVLLAIGVIGSLIYGTLVRRLRQLQQVTQAVQRGQFTSRAMVDGQDEITDVATSVNAMLDSIVSLLDETRLQRDALMQAAKRLFSEIRLANGDAFDVSTAVTADPIVMLGNAFQFTVGRFRRFILRTKRTIEPLEDISQRESELAATFLAAIRNALRESPTTIPSTPAPGGNTLYTLGKMDSSFRQEQAAAGNTTILAHVDRVREQVQIMARRSVEQQGEALLHLLDQAYQYCERLTTDARSRNPGGLPNAAYNVQALETLLRQFEAEAQARQKHTLEQLVEAEVTLNRLASTVRSEGSRRIPLNTAAVPMQEISRLAEGFAQEVTTLAQRLQILTQEMRNNLTPFRSEISEKSHGVTQVW